MFTLGQDELHPNTIHSASLCSLEKQAGKLIKTGSALQLSTFDVTNSTQSHKCDFSISTEVSWEDAGRRPRRTCKALYVSPVSWFISVPPIALRELQVSTNCNTNNQFNSNKPIANCRGDLATKFSLKQLLASKPATE